MPSPYIYYNETDDSWWITHYSPKHSYRRGIMKAYVYIGVL